MTAFFFNNFLNRSLIKVFISTNHLSISDHPTSEVVLHQGESVMVIGVSAKRGHLIVEKRHHTVHVPFQYLENSDNNAKQHHTHQAAV